MVVRPPLPQVGIMGGVVVKHEIGRRRSGGRVLSSFAGKMLVKFGGALVG